MLHGAPTDSKTADKKRGKKPKSRMSRPTSATVSVATTATWLYSNWTVWILAACRTRDFMPSAPICIHDTQQWRLFTEAKQLLKKLDGKYSETVQLRAKAIADCHHNGGARLMEQPLPQCWSTNHVPSWICIFGMFTTQLWNMGFLSPTLGNTCHTYC